MPFTSILEAVKLVAKEAVVADTAYEELKAYEAEVELKAYEELKA